jgi:hypothetical protein
VQVYDDRKNTWLPGVVHELRAPSSTALVRLACGVRREVHLLADVWRREDEAAAAVQAVRVGSRLSLYWPGEGACFNGRVGAHDGERGLWLLLYDDGDSRVRARQRGLALHPLHALQLSGPPTGFLPSPSPVS